MPLPQGQYVGYAPSPLTGGYTALTRHQECRDNFGPGARWCTALDMDGLPDINVLPDAPTQSEATPIIVREAPAFIEATTPSPTRNVYYWREGSKVFAALLTTGSIRDAALGPACCMEPTP